MAVNVHTPRPAGLPGPAPQSTRAEARGLALWVQPGEGTEIDAATMARAAELIRLKAQQLAPGAQISIWPASGPHTSGVGASSDGGTPTETADAGNLPSQASRKGAPTAESTAGATIPLAGRRSRVAVDLAGDVVLLDGDPVAFTSMEYKLLRYLVVNCSRAIGREELQRFIEFLDCPGAAFRSIDVYVGRIRRKLGSARHVVATVRGGGYQFVPGPHATVRGPAEYSI